MELPERRGIIQQDLEQAGYIVEIFATMRALESAEQQQPCLMIVAIELPDGSGVAFCDQDSAIPRSFQHRRNFGGGQQDETSIASCSSPTPTTA